MAKKTDKPASEKKTQGKRKPRGRSFEPGNPGGPGRPKGKPNKATVEIREAARALVVDRLYRTSLRARLIEGSAPHMETLLHHYAFGKPKETIDIGDDWRKLVAQFLGVPESEVTEPS